MSREIHFKIDKGGNVSIEGVKGYGTSCREATSSIEKRLGMANEGSRKDTEDLHLPPESLNLEQNLG